jgi:hypothetical protein
VVAAEQQHVDHLMGGVRAPVATCERRPQLVETRGPGAAAALLRQGERVLHAAGLAGEQLEVMVQPGAGRWVRPSLPIQPIDTLGLLRNVDPEGR